MNNLVTWYASYLWQDIDAVDALVLKPALDAPDDDAAFARQLYHRYLAHLLSEKLWHFEWWLLGFAGFLSFILNLPRPLLPLWAGIPLAIIFVVGVVYAGRFVIARFLTGDHLELQKTTAERLVQRVCTREIPAAAPTDLKDPWRHGWLLADGRPVSAEIAESDLRSSAIVARARACLWVALGVGLVPLSFTSIGLTTLYILFGIALFKLFADPSPAAMRAKLLDAAAANVAEGAAWAFGGASKWAAQFEAARTRQLQEAIRDKSPIIRLGTALGILAARGDALAPSKGLDMSLSLNDLMQHLLVLGGTGSGKTAGVLRPVCKQIGELKDVGLIVLDGKGSLPGEISKLVPEFTIIDPATKAMSLVEGLTPTEIASTIAEILSANASKDKFFDESATALLRYAAVLAKLSGGVNDSLTGIWQIASAGPDEELLGRAKPSIPEQAEAADYFQNQWTSIESKTQSSILATLRTWYTTITGHPDTLKWAQTPAGKSDVDIIAALKGTRIGILAPAHRYGQAGRVIMALLKARIYAAIRDRADRGMTAGETPVVMVIDEAQEITTKQDALMLGIARSLNLSVIASTQTIEGIEAQLGKEDAARYLTLFGSVVALQNRSPRTAELVAGRIGASFRPVIDEIPGVPTVRGAVWAQRASGRLAAAKNQPTIAGTIEVGEGSRIQDLFAAINPFQLFKKTLAGDQERPTTKLEAKSLVDEKELNELIVEPDTAMAVLTRARVPRRDVVKLHPVFNE